MQYLLVIMWKIKYVEDINYCFQEAHSQNEETLYILKNQV